MRHTHTHTCNWHEWLRFFLFFHSFLPKNLGQPHLIYIYINELADAMRFNSLVSRQKNHINPIKKEFARINQMMTEKWAQIHSCIPRWKLYWCNYSYSVLNLQFQLFFNAQKLATADSACEREKKENSDCTAKVFWIELVKY